MNHYVMFYQSLLRSESRHFEDYLFLAELYAEQDISERVNTFRELENKLIAEEDKEFRFHSGPPVNNWESLVDGEASLP